MKQLQQSLENGLTKIVDVPMPKPGPREVRIISRCSLISAGTERMLVSFGKSNLFNKARQQPGKVRQVLQKAKTDGISETVKAVKSKLAEPIPMGYSNVGVVDAIGSEVRRIKPGMRVVSNGFHAEVVLVSESLVEEIPDNVSDETASYTVVSSIALQGVRLIKPQLGEKIAVIGLGLIGLLAVQILRANGCDVIGFDYDPTRVTLAERYGAMAFNLNETLDPISNAFEFTKQMGVDAVIIATSTSSREPINLAAKMSRQRGRIVLIGTADISLDREDFYKKELCFQVSCSYGPGRYDRDYELKGNDYPFGLVRWTVKRNFQAALNLMLDGKLKTSDLKTHSFQFHCAEKAYALLENKKENPIGIILLYGSSSENSLNTTSVFYSPSIIKTDNVNAAFIGAGSYANKVLIPSFKSEGASMLSISSKNGLSAALAAKKFSFNEATTDIDEQISGRANTLIIATPHESHAELVLAGLSAGKNIFVEKPLCISFMQLEKIESALKNIRYRPVLMVGFNRRFAPLAVKMKNLLSQELAPKSMIYTINAGSLDQSHWAQDKSVSGGRMIGEVCHFIDLLRFLVGKPINSVTASNMDSQNTDTATIIISFTDGSIGTVHYFANGHNSVSKERLEVFCNGKILQLNNFRSLRGYGWNKFKSEGRLFQDKGQKGCVKSFVAAVKAGGCEPIPVDELIEVTKFSLEAACIQS